MCKTAKTLISIALVCGLLTACGQEILDSRQIDNNGGLAYKHGSNDPYTGVIEFKDTIPTDLEEYWKTNVASVPGHPTEQVLSGCQERYVKGLPDGDAWCDGTGGHKAFEFHYTNKQFDGPSKLYNADTGDLIKDQSWSEGKLDGTVKTYTYDGKQLLAQVDWKEGVPDGVVKEWNIQGEQITDAIYKAGQVDSGKWGTDDGSAKTSTEYNDGKPNGKFLKLSKQGDVLQKGQYVDGLSEGTWEYRGEDTGFIIAKLSDSFLVFPINLDALGKAVLIDSHWSHGKVDGEMRGWDKDGKPMFDFHLINGLLDGPNQTVAQPSGPMKTFAIKAGQLVADPESESSAAPPTQASPVAPGAQPEVTSSINSPAEALAGGVQLPGTGNACLDDWETAYRKERGDDAIVAVDQIDEWTEECKQGKTAPKN